MDIVKASEEHIKGIQEVCAAGNWATYGEYRPAAYLERIIEEFYNTERILNEVTHTGRDWGGYFVAVEDEKVIGAGGGGMIGDEAGEIYVLYLHPERRNEGIGTKLLEALTEQQKQEGAKEQWVSVAKENKKGIPFYEAKGFQFDHEQLDYGNADGEQFVSLRYYRRI